MQITSFRKIYFFNFFVRFFWE